MRPKLVYFLGEFSLNRIVGIVSKSPARRRCCFGDWRAGRDSNPHSPDYKSGAVRLGRLPVQLPALMATPGVTAPGVAICLLSDSPIGHYEEWSGLCRLVPITV